MHEFSSIPHVIQETHFSFPSVPLLRVCLSFLGSVDIFFKLPIVFLFEYGRNHDNH